MSKTIKQIKKLMNKQNVSQKYMADMVGVTETTMSKWLNGIRCPNIEDAEKMVLILGYKIGFIYIGGQK